MNSRTMIGKHNPIANQLRAGTNQPKVIPNKKRGLKPMADELLSFIVPSYHVTSCQNCPSAEYSEYYGTTECSEVYDESLGDKLYRENCEGLTSSCPRLKL